MKFTDVLEILSADTFKIWLAGRFRRAGGGSVETDIKNKIKNNNVLFIISTKKPVLF